MKYVGIDLGKKKSQIAVLDEEGKFQLECKIANTSEAFQKIFRSLGKDVMAVCEAGNKAFWVVDILEELGVKTTVANTYKVRVIAEARVKTDKVDARILAQLLKADFVPHVQVPPKEIRTWKEIARGRIHLVRIRVQLYNRMHAVLDRYAVEYDSKQLHNKQASTWISTLDQLPEVIKRVMTRYLAQIDYTTKDVKLFEQELKEIIETDETMSRVIKLLQTIPGIGLLSATNLYLDLYDITRFANYKKVNSYIGITPGVHQSSTVSRGTRITKQGNSLLRWLAIEAAWTAIRYDSFYNNLYLLNRQRLGSSRAILPVARAIICAVYHVWKKASPYNTVFKHSQSGKYTLIKTS